MKYTSITIALLLTAAGAIKLDQKDAVVQSTTAMSLLAHEDGEHHESEDEADHKDHASDDEAENSGEDEGEGEQGGNDEEEKVEPKNDDDDGDDKQKLS
jgi:hypothetical protein